MFTAEQMGAAGFTLTGGGGDGGSGGGTGAAAGGASEGPQTASYSTSASVFIPLLGSHGTEMYLYGQPP